MNDATGRRALAIAIMLLNDYRTPDELKPVIESLIETLEKGLGISGDTALFNR